VHFQLVFKSVLNEVFTSITLQMKTFQSFQGARSFQGAHEVTCHLFIYATSGATHMKSE